MTQKNKIPARDIFSKIALQSAPASAPQAFFGIANPDQANGQEIAFIASESFLSQLNSSQAGLVVVSASLKEKVESLTGNLPPIAYVKDAMLAFADCSELFCTEAPHKAGIHPTAVIDPEANVSAEASIGPYVYIGAGTKVGPKAWIGPHVVVGRNVEIGEGVYLFPQVVVYDNVKIGKRTRIHASSVVGADGFGYVQRRSPQGVEHVKIHHLGGVIIGEDVEVGANSSIDRGTLGNTIIENGCKIDNHVQVGHNCHFEQGVVICGSSGIAGSTQIGKFSLLAGFVGVGNKTKIGAGAIVAAFSMVFGKVPDGAKWGGVPARSQKEYMRLQVLISRLPELFAARRAANKLSSEETEE